MTKAPDHVAEVRVEQVDRMAAIELVSPDEARRIALGECDDHMLVQAFAVHRMAALRKFEADHLAGVGEGLPSDVARLVIAARWVAYDDPDPKNMSELDKAAEAFASRVPWNAAFTAKDKA